jgi:hypothetical protein
MTAPRYAVRFAIALLLLGSLSAQQPAAVPAYYFRLSEVKYGSMAAEQRCVVVAPDRKFHFEHANRKQGRDLTRKVYEGELSPAEWDAFLRMIEAKDFRELKVQPQMRSPIVENLDLVQISAWRDKGYQNLEFLDKKARAPYEATLKPVLAWWKEFSSRKLNASSAAASKYCAMESNDNVLFAPGM